MGIYALAFVAGILSFSSPCCLPLLPGYIAFVSGSQAELERGGTVTRAAKLRAPIAFVLGFATVFTALGAGSALLGGLLLSHRVGLTQIAGIFIVFMGLATLGVFRSRWLGREWRMDLSKMTKGPRGAYPLGMAFAFGWTPCIGPVLASILALSSGTGTALRGATLLFVYSLGLGLPFLGLAALTEMRRFASWLTRHARSVELVSGSLLVVLGILMITGYWLRLFIPILRWFSSVNWPPI